jgi:hypothetical protein
MTDNFRNPARMTADERQLAAHLAANPQSLTQQLWSAPQPLHDDTARVQAMIDAQQPITHAAILAAVKRLPDNLDGPAAIADALCNALGVEVPVKVAPWEVALDDWQAARNSLGGAEPDYSIKGTWQAAWAACEAHHGIGGADQ